MPWLWIFMFGCILDRTGQSASESMRRQLLDQGVRVANLEQQFIQVEARVNQMEDLTRTQGRQDNMKMETLDDLRSELSRMRGEVEVLSHASGEGAKEIQARTEDATFRVEWLESRADQLEKALGLKPPSPPQRVVEDEAAEQDSTWKGEIVGAGDAEPANAGTAESAASPPVVTGAQTSDGQPDPDQLLDGGKGLLDQENAAGAASMFSRFLELYPKHKRAAEAKYRLADSSKVAGQYQQAILQFQTVIDQHKMSAFASWAMFKQGECFALQGQPANAKVFFNEVIRIFPKSRAADQARQKLRQ